MFLPNVDADNYLIRIGGIRTMDRRRSMAKHRISTSGLLNYIRDQCFNDWDVEPGRNSSMTSTICVGRSDPTEYFFCDIILIVMGTKRSRGVLHWYLGAEFSSHGRDRQQVSLVGTPGSALPLRGGSNLVHLGLPFNERHTITSSVTERFDMRERRGRVTTHLYVGPFFF